MSIVGLDECGRGALAGPLVACACKFIEPLYTFADRLPCKIKDSKITPKKHREIIDGLKDTLPISYKTIEISVEDINLHGIAWANVQAFTRLAKLFAGEEIIADGNIRFLSQPIKSIIKADALYPEVSLASIIAKVYRDKLMSDLAIEFPGFGWEHNAGYGTKDHLLALVDRGSTCHHRHVFVRTAISNLTRSQYPEVV